MPATRRFIALLVLLSLLLSPTALLTFAQQSTNTSVSLTVPLRDEDIPLSISRTDGDATTQEDATLTYQIMYSSLLSYAVPLTITASWSTALVNGAYVDLADYVNGSGTDAYNGTPVVIDTVNKRITWTISSLPANTTDQIVSFSLRTNSNYTGSTPISFTVSAGAASGGSSITPATITQYYAHTQPSSSSSSSSSSPTSSPASAITPTPTVIIVPQVFSLIEVQTLSSTSATAFISLLIPAKLTIRYGTSPTKLNNVLRVAEKVKNYTAEFPELLPKTRYYFTITANTETTQTTSDIYTFTTSKGPPTSIIDLPTLIITADNMILTPTFFKKDSLPSAIITINTPFEFRFAVSDSEKIRKTVAIVKNAQVLGINSYAKSFLMDASTESVEIVEIAPGVYSGRLTSKHISGNYTLFARISDDNENVTEQAIATLHVVKPLTILENGTNKPIENARVLIYRKHSRTSEYTLLSEQSIAIKNPAFTEPDGTIAGNLIPGEYKIRVSATSYTSQDSYFTLSSLHDKQYPVLYLQKHGFSPLSTVQFYVEIVGDFLFSFRNYATTLGISNRLFMLASLSSLCIFIIVTILSFCIRFHIPFTALPAYFFSLVHLHRTKKTAQILCGVIRDEKSGGFPISNAIIYLLDKKRRRILLHTQTNALGQFTLALPPASEYLLIVKKRHYITVEHAVSTFENIDITLEKDQSSENRFTQVVQSFCKNLLGLFFEVLLILSFVLETIFATSFGIIMVTPYLLLSIITLAFWLLFVRGQRSIYTT